ncbi:MAG: ferrous iron transporter B [Bdellovibrionales bacterium]|nr:ferrous iron transporter B [Bdellovibrionales bacterium]
MEVETPSKKTIVDTHSKSKATNSGPADCHADGKKVRKFDPNAVRERPRIALVGTPNSGKTALFNLLTHSNQRVANYAGVTVDSAESDLRLESGTEASLVDLPGAYSLRPYTDDESVLADALQSNAFDGMILVVDSTQSERAIRFLIEVLDSTDLPAIVAFNMVDLAKSRGFDFDFQKLSQLLGVPVIPTVAVKRSGLSGLIKTLEETLGNQKRKKHALLPKADSTPTTRQEVAAQILSFYKLADEYLKQFMCKPGTPDYQSQKIDKYVLHPVWGALILIAVLGITFQLMFNLAQVPMDWIDVAFKWMGDSVNQMQSLPVALKSFLADGIIAGVGGTLVFLPQILILFGLILFLEDFGFMARAVFLLDHWMGKVGLHGRAFLPLLSSYACAVPGIMSLRTIESRRDRIVTALIIPLTTCSARIPVYTLLISAFVPNNPVIFGVRLQGLVMLGLYLVGTLSALAMGAVFKTFFLRGPRPPLLIELPSYKLPSVVSVVKGLVYRGKLFIRRVGTIILSLTVVIWVLVSYPSPGEGSYAAKLGHFIEPAIKPLGFDWKVGMALVPTFAAREVMVATLATVYAVGDDAAVSNTDKLSEMIQKEWSLATGLSLLVFFIFAPMCISTIAAAKRQLQSNGWTVTLVLYLFAMAYLASFITYRLAS